jgi:hypothetical protein
METVGTNVRMAIRARATLLLLAAVAIAATAGASGLSSHSQAAGKAGPDLQPGSGSAIRALSEVPLPASLRYARDVRWASDRSVYVANLRSGVIEVALDGRSPLTRAAIPGASAAGGFWMSGPLGVSSTYLAVASPVFNLTWRRLDQPVRQEESFEFIHDIDVQDNRLAVVGARRDARGTFAPDGDIAWIGSLDKGLADLKPLIYSSLGPGARNMNACGTFGIGAVRFLADRTLLVVAGVQPGISQFDARGRLFRSWDTVALGIDTDCASIDREQTALFARSFPKRLGWINARTTVDDILPLAAGPGLLIRRIASGRTTWTLKVLRADGTTLSFDVPIVSRGITEHLKGDLRQGQMALLLWAYSQDGMPDKAPPPHLYLAAAPAL